MEPATDEKPQTFEEWQKEDDKRVSHNSEIATGILKEKGRYDDGKTAEPKKE